MDFINSWLISICGATVITGIFKIFLSGSTLKRSINIFLSVFMLFYTVIPLSNFTLKNENEAETPNYSYEEYFESGYNQIIEEAIKTHCAKNNIEVLSAEIDSYIDDEDILCVEKIYINIDEPERKDEIENSLKNELGFEVIVVEN